MKNLFLFLFSTLIFAQQKPLKLSIDHITTTRAQGERIYTIRYSISNQSNQAVSFLLKPNQLMPINGGSLRPLPYYKIFQDGKTFDADGMFTTKGQRRVFKDEAAFKAFTDSLATAVNQKSPEQLEADFKKDFLNLIQSLGPLETKKYEVELMWDEQRYHKNGDIEYYADEKGVYELELHIHLMDRELLTSLEEKERENFLKELHLTKGWYTSNRVLLDLGE